jgi:pentapeptide MXKDX repeat protein
LHLHAHLIAGIDTSRFQIQTTELKERFMKKLICRLMVLCFLSVSLAAFAQSGGDTMKQDNMKQDSMKNDDMAKDKKASKTKKTKTKKSDMKKADSMKHDDTMKHDDSMKQN